MSKKFKKGQKVWVYYSRNHDSIVCQEGVYLGEYDNIFTNVQRTKEKYCDFVWNGHVFPTKQECIDYITNSIKVIPYEDTTSN